MDQLTRNKVLIGSLYKNINIARVTGLMDLKMLYLLNIVNSYILSCENAPEFKEIQKLKQIALIIQNREKNICNYRFNDLIKFANIVGCENCKPGLNNNPFGISNNNPTISNPNPIPPSPQCPSLCKTITINYSDGLFFVPLFNTSDSFDNLTEVCYSSPDDSPAQFIKITGLPSYGTLVFTDELGGTDTVLTLGSVINIDSLSNGILQYIYTGNPSNDIPGNSEDSFKISLGDSQNPTLYSSNSNVLLIPIKSI